MFLNTTATDYQTHNSAASCSTSYQADVAHTRKLEANRRFAIESYTRVLQEVIEMETVMGIDVRWQVGDENFQKALKYMSERKFHHALIDLRGLVIKRLFELQDLNLARTGECSFIILVC